MLLGQPCMENDIQYVDFALGNQNVIRFHLCMKSWNYWALATILQMNHVLLYTCWCWHKKASRPSLETKNTSSHIPTLHSFDSPCLHGVQLQHGGSPPFSWNLKRKHGHVTPTSRQSECICHSSIQAHVHSLYIILNGGGLKHSVFQSRTSTRVLTNTHSATTLLLCCLVNGQVYYTNKIKETVLASQL